MFREKLIALPRRQKRLIGLSVDIDMPTPELLVKTDAEIIKGLSVTNYFRYLLMTLAGCGQGDRVK
ncbi:hypothetical protein [Endozoicomonas sp.]|uniref:hypothetical protein n=1 Tax=Endozoicomonas sp. TaxID=1892382 RepID=UPI003D9B4DC2